MKQSKKFLGVLLVFVLALTLTACGQNNDTTPEGGDSGSGDIKIGYVINNLNDTFQTIVLDTAKKYAEENNIELLVNDAQEDTIKQQDLVKSLVEKGVQGIIVVPTDTSAMEPITNIAKEANVPLAYVNRNPYAGKEDSIPENVYYVGANEKQAGTLQMEFIGEQLNGEGGVAVLMGILGNEGAVKRTEGVEEVMQEKYPNMKLLAKETGNWQRDQGLTLTENFLTTYGEELRAIAANNDEMALGAIQALKTNNKLGDVIVLGVDATPDAIASVEAGELNATVFQDPKQGEESVKIVLDAINGNSIEEQIKYIPFKLVTPENVAEYK